MLICVEMLFAEFVEKVAESWLKTALASSFAINGVSSPIFKQRK